MTFPATAEKMLNRRRAILLLNAVALLPFAGSARSEGAAGSVEVLVGSAAASRGPDSRGLSVGNALFVDDVVSTDASSRLAMRLGATTIRLGELTLLRIDRYLAEIGGTLSLGEGAILFDRPADAATENMSIRGAFGLIAVRGTSFFAGPSQGRSSVFVDRGSVTVRSGGVTVALNAGEGTDVASMGKPPSAPRRWSPERIEAALASIR